MMRLRITRPITNPPKHFGSLVSTLILTLTVFAASSSVSQVRAPGKAQEQAPANDSNADWQIYGGQAENDHYSSLTQINRKNADHLKLAWTFDTQEKGGLQTSPLIVGHALFAFTPSLKVISLDAATGKLLWTFDSGIKGTQPSRGLAYWHDTKEGRLFAGVMNYLYALDPATGKPITSFAEGGRIDLRKLLRGDYEKQSIALTTPGIIYKDLIIVGGRNPETHPSPPGDIRAFDVRTGALRWAFHTIPHPGEVGYETWPVEAWRRSGAANNWAGMALDTKRGIVYAPTGSSVFDFYGADRVGDDLYANSLLALDAETGKRIWHFQDVHHDVWDRDFPSPPTLFSFVRAGKQIDALAQTTKQGYLYLFDRVTGKPLFPIKEYPYPFSTVPDEVTSPTQPKPLAPEPFARQAVTEDMLTTRTPEAHEFALKQFKTFRSGGQFIPFSVDQQTVVFPGFDGGAEWGGSALDKRTNVLYINANEMAWTGGLTATQTSGTPGERTYHNLCAVCHGSNKEGAPPAFPALLDINRRLSGSEITLAIRQGKGRMPGFPNIDNAGMLSLLDFLKAKDANSKQEMSSTTRSSNTNNSEQPSDSDEMKYQFTGYKKFLDQDGYPAITPPWGTLSAIDLNTGKYLWKIPLGEYPDLAAKGIKNTGTENYGGSIVTAGGLIFIGATLFDNKFRVFDSTTGKLLWQTTLPFAATATPATYMIDGKQYVVISAGGKDPRTPSGGTYSAFALP